MTPVTERVMRRVEISPSGCWVFTGSTTPGGYGTIRLGGRKSSGRVAHRVMWEAVNGPVPDGLDLDHLCRVRACVNPDHLEPVTRAENVARGLGHKGSTRVTHCHRGHEYTPENTKRLGNGRRRCRICFRERERAKYRRTYQPKGRLKSECIHGHPMSGENLEYLPSGRRCRTCARRRAREYQRGLQLAARKDTAA